MTRPATQAVFYFLRGASAEAVFGLWAEKVICVQSSETLKITNHFFLLFRETINYGPLRKPILAPTEDFRRRPDLFYPLGKKKVLYCCALPWILNSGDGNFLSDDNGDDDDDDNDDDDDDNQHNTL